MLIPDCLRHITRSLGRVSTVRGCEGVAEGLTDDGETCSVVCGFGLGFKGSGHWSRKLWISYLRKSWGGRALWGVLSVWSEGEARESATFVACHRSLARNAPEEQVPRAEASSTTHALAITNHIDFDTTRHTPIETHEAMSGPIASAVVLPEPDDAPPPASPPNALKRRQSSVTEDSVKRARTNGDDAADESKAPAPKRRERGRERRLFGAVLGALSQNPTTAGQKRRSEIEKRQQAQRRQEDEESEQRKAERLARRKVQRWKEQKRFERQAVRRKARLVTCRRANMSLDESSTQ